jgi:hypothetical protein
VGRPETETGPSLRKNREKQNPGWPSDLASPDQKLGCNHLTFVFLLKRRRFDFLKKKELTRATR